MPKSLGSLPTGKADGVFWHVLVAQVGIKGHALQLSPPFNRARIAPLTTLYGFMGADL